ncbi:MAG: apolipoprotein N-acyltransferase [Candidatus Omnitrophica bacterium]|nr:apolipoprotein N-acyltransferase [Candidatus Omnitrophota bacterium]
MKKHVLNITLAVLSGVLGFLAFPPFEYSALAWFSLVPLLVAARVSNLRGAILCGYISGVVFFGGLLSWLVYVSVPGFIFAALYLGVFFALFSAVANMFFRRELDLMVLPFVWVLLEYIRGHLFTGFPWCLLGYSQYRTLALIQIADVTGPYGVSFLLAAFNTGLAAVFLRERRKIHYLMTASILSVIAIMYGTGRIDKLPEWGSLRPAVVQPNIPQEEKWDPFYAASILETYEAMTLQAAAGKPDIIIWPEAAYPYLAEEGEYPAPEVSDIALRAKTPLLAGIVDTSGGKNYNSAYLFDAEGRVVERYAKMHLVPWGEYIPYEDRIAWVRDLIDKPIGSFVGGRTAELLPLTVARSYASADGSLKKDTFFYKLGVLICFEDVFPYISRQFVAGGASFLVNITNDGWFGDTGAGRQHLMASVFRAVENKVPVVRAANTGVSCFISPIGEIISRVENEYGKDTFVKGIDTADIKIYRGRTLYTKHGDQFVLFSGGMAVMFMLFTALTRRRKG